MNWIITISVGFVGGIMFASAYPESAVAINNTLRPIVDTGMEVTIDILRTIIDGILRR